jgi:hypothetical protein
VKRLRAPILTTAEGSFGEIAEAQSHHPGIAKPPVYGKRLSVQKRFLLVIALFLTNPAEEIDRRSQTCLVACRSEQMERLLRVQQRPLNLKMNHCQISGAHERLRTNVHGRPLVVYISIALKQGLKPGASFTGMPYKTPCAPQRCGDP